MASKADEPIRVLRIKKDDDLKTIYAKVKKAFTAADLARYATEEPMYPAEELLAELEAAQQADDKKRQKQAKRKAK